MYYLDTVKPRKNFEECLRSRTYVDKSLMIEKLNEFIGINNKYICITRPRRFGKTINANMLGAYYTLGDDSHDLFDGLKIANSSVYETYMNQYHVIFIDFSRMPKNCDSFNDYISWIQRCLELDLKEAFGVEGLPDDPIEELLLKTQEEFVFVLDEWDSIFYKKFMSDSQKQAYLEFIKGLLKDQPYVKFAYMTGVLPIAKYSSGSELNMFAEFNTMNSLFFSEFFGITEDEAKALCEKEKTISYEELAHWYDGYIMKNGLHIFNPRSVSMAFIFQECRNYWTETGPMNEIANCIEHNVDAVREDIVKMVAGIPIEVELEGYSAMELQLNSRDEILSAMVVYGFLSYHNCLLTIPNYELMEKFQSVLKRESMGDVANIVMNSKQILEATLQQEEDKVAEFLEYAHDREIPFLQYNDENSLSCVITLCYLYARNKYDIRREAKSGKGYVDYLFVPLQIGYPAIILELKYDKSAQDAIDQIKQKNYIDEVRDCEEILLVGINYDKQAKKHTCIIEKITNRKE